MYLWRKYQYLQTTDLAKEINNVYGQKSETYINFETKLNVNFYKTCNSW